ncbi:MAG: hemolysin III family protein, partial [Vicinamibacteria bacterium]
MKLSVSHEWPPESFREEFANSLSHGAGLLAALVATPFLIAAAVRKGNAAFVAGAAVFALTVLVLYLGSTLYHALPAGRAKHVFRIIDHCAIYLLIAGTYTPFTLGALSGVWGWSLLVAVWSLAAIGITLEVTDGRRHPGWSLSLYLVMGWLVIVAIRPLSLHLPLAGLIWLVAGGLAYTAGVLFYSAKGLRFGHFVW